MNPGEQGLVDWPGCFIESAETDRKGLLWANREVGANLRWLFRGGADFNLMREYRAGQEFELQLQLWEQGGSDLPAYGMGVVAKKVEQIVCLPQFVKAAEVFDVSVAVVENCKRLESTWNDISLENRFVKLGVRLDVICDALPFGRVITSDYVGQESEVVAHDVRVGLSLELLNVAALKVVIEPFASEDKPPGKYGAVREFQINISEEADRTRFNIGARLAGVESAMLGGRKMPVFWLCSEKVPESRSLWGLRPESIS